MGRLHNAGYDKGPADAKRITVDASGFSGFLSASDTDVQKALATIDGSVLSVMELKGAWNADTNTPALADGTGTAGDVYVVTTAGTQDLGSGDIVFNLGDWVVYDGSVWFVSRNAELIGDVSSIGNTTSLEKWSGGNVIYVPLDGSIADAITAATAGDTIQLGAGTYTITAELAVNKKLHIKGMGRGITTIACATNNDMFDLTAAGWLISDLTIEKSGAVTGTSNVVADIRDDGTFMEVEFLTKATGNNTTGLIVIQNTYEYPATINLINCTHTNTGEIGFCFFTKNSEPGADAIINLFNCHSSSIAIASPYAAYGAVLIANNVNATTNIYGGSYVNPTNTNGGVIKTYNANAKINVYEGAVISGAGATAYDVENSTGTITLYSGTTLVNNKTSGTITYAGTGTIGTTTTGGADSAGAGKQYVELSIGGVKYKLLHDGTI
ncbi:MAG: hypothetical protein M0P69_01535 [Bacteroidales bacterium]|nr:hypothetical protein [Bacteroidales bacterium]